MLFDKPTILYLTSVREALINCALSNKIIFQDTRKFIPHITLLASYPGNYLNNREISFIKSLLKTLNSKKIKNLKYNAIMVLTPRGRTPTNLDDIRIIQLAKKLIYKFS